MADVLKLAAKDPKLARRLAQALLAAKTEDQAAGAFALIKEESITAGATDPEVIRKAKVQSMVTKFVMRGELAMSKIKDAFNKAAFSAKQVGEVDQAMKTAGESATAALKDINAQLDSAVKGM